MIETHPFGNFVPPKAKYLLLGSFPGRIETRYGDWFYETQRGQFWSIIQEIYGVNLKSKTDKIRLFTRLKIAVGDVIYKCERISGNNADNNLVRCLYNTKAIEKILKKNNIEKIFFSSRFVENKFRRFFKALINQYPKIELVALPSSSPRYAKMTLKDKSKVYTKLLPKMTVLKE